MSDKYSFMAFRPQLGFDNNAAQPRAYLIPDADGNWVDRHTAEHLVDMLKRAEARIAELERREVVIPSIMKHFGTGKVCCIYEQAMTDAGIKWRSVDDKPV